MKSKKLRKLRSKASRFVGYRTLMGTHGIYGFAHGKCEANRIALVNHLVTVYGYRHYLEIGTRNKSDMHENILAEFRTSVDPDPTAEADHCCTSDEYFKTTADTFDIIFIDGLHTGEQVYRDINGALAALNPGGVILLHDLNPPTAFHAREEYEVNGTFPSWNGTSWEGYARHRVESPNLEMYVVDVDWGVGFVRPGRQICYSGSVSGYENLERDRHTLLNLITVRDFLQRHPKARVPYSPLDPLIARS
ncbi:class I SAM-dependent methyltransferase [uncultured Roseobacter sp.]|uniref:class I SAM-dependent methyltransferase n=1 Tax=uncultured Roseobacter sp. TaxID=114847 RepID=UPI002618EAC5|nr:class I SAM-dependent methyltransferase [uncultured Roseobacter sp.]